MYSVWEQKFMLIISIHFLSIKRTIPFGGEVLKIPPIRVISSVPRPKSPDGGAIVDGNAKAPNSRSRHAHRCKQETRGQVEILSEI